MTTLNKEVHTPGPWEYSGNSTGAVRAHNDLVASVYGDNGEATGLSMAANARLIAAAPELLGALNGILGRYARLVESGDAGNWDCELEPQVIAARAAIAKATVAP